jgi:hypothetical protein
MLINSSELCAAGFKIKEVIGFKIKKVLKCFLQYLRQLLACAHEERDYEILRVWVLKGLFCQWMMTLNSGHDVSE